MIKVHETGMSEMGMWWKVSLSLTLLILMGISSSQSVEASGSRKSTRAPAMQVHKASQMAPSTFKI